MRLAFIIPVLLAACTSAQVKQQVPVSSACLGESPAEPKYEFGEGEFPGGKEASKVLLRDLNKAKQYADDLKTQMAGCK